MSRVYLIAADKSLPLCDSREESSRTFGEHTISIVCGFRIAEHAYYRSCVDELGLAMKPYQCELELEENEKDLTALRAYLQAHFSPGESVELWSVWVGDVTEPRPRRYQGKLSEFDMETLRQFLGAERICITVMI